MTYLSDDHCNRVWEILGSSPLLPVITIHAPEHALPLCRALVAGGVGALEITLRSRHGLQAIREVSEALPEVWVGAGTVTCIDQYRAVEQAGAQFVVTPGITEAILKFGVTSRVPLLPGISTASDLMMGHALGYRVFKFFPAEVAGGVAALQAFAGPFADVSFCPTGGIRQDTAKAYLAEKNVIAVGGSWMTPTESVAGADWPAITRIARESLAEL